ARRPPTADRRPFHSNPERYPMSVEIRVPPLGESVVEATVGRWTKQEGEAVAKDEVLVELETDKITVEVAAQKAGVLASIDKKEGDTVGVDDLLGSIDDAAGATTADQAGETASAKYEEKAAAPAGAPHAEAREGAQVSPAARAIAGEHGIDLAEVRGTGPNGRVTKEDVLQIVEQRTRPPQPPAPAPAQRQAPPQAPAAPAAPAQPVREGRETRERMSRRRQTIARRLVEAQQTTASLTTFNEVDLSAVQALRKRRQDVFVKLHGIKLGYMSFFTKAVVGALKQFPHVNAEIQGDEIVVKHYYDIGIAVGSEEGLVVPVVRDADRKSFAEIEQSIAELAAKARDGKLSLQDLQGGTFTITNGGTYGSMLSTPILNPPQVGILGMHNIVERPVVVDGKIEIRPIMYLALTYDHRLVDGSTAVRFLVTVKQLLEDPATMLLEG
ncbi:MAG TPA: 2-oxoglutarate dehydrogenase complex dihydrolipoyllysine-residue succinyltransferase, partial [Longimicrobiaceae bacterium]|nr:2-oxoglutarate dehydrogenase complex dihydrolipoyllysine-residue succinyltransferase [Longimicrobiaceae bacterium]